jgi:excisionase family DNA binding protein
MRQTQSEHASPPAPADAVLLYRIADVVRVTGISRSKVYQLIAAGDLRTVHFGRSVHITADSLNALIARRTDPVRTPPAPSETRQLLHGALVRSRTRPARR